MSRYEKKKPATYEEMEHEIAVSQRFASVMFRCSLCGQEDKTRQSRNNPKHCRMCNGDTYQTRKTYDNN